VTQTKGRKNKISTPGFFTLKHLTYAENLKKEGEEGSRNSRETHEGLEDPLSKGREGEAKGGLVLWQLEGGKPG